MHRYMEQTDRCQREGWYWMKGEGISQRTYMYDPLTRTTVWGLPEGRGSWREVGKGGKIGDNCNSVNNKIQFKKRI